MGVSCKNWSGFLRGGSTKPKAVSLSPNAATNRLRSAIRSPLATHPPEAKKRLDGSRDILEETTQVATCRRSFACAPPAKARGRLLGAPRPTPSPLGLRQRPRKGRTPVRALRGDGGAPPRPAPKAAAARTLTGKHPAAAVPTAYVQCMHGCCMQITRQVPGIFGRDWWRGRDSNPRPRDYESRALTS